MRNVTPIRKKSTINSTSEIKLWYDVIDTKILSLGINVLIKEDCTQSKYSIQKTK